MTRLPSTPTTGRLLAFAAMALAWSAVAGSAQEAEGLPPPAHVSYVDGRVLLDRETGTEDAELSMPLVPGDRIRTEDGRAEILFGDGSLAQLDAETALDLLSDARLRLLEGRLAVVATAAQAGRLQIDTPEGTVAISLAGEYTLRLFDADGRATLELSVVRGQADLASDSDRVTVSAGERSWARTGEAPAYPVRFNAAAFDGFDQWALGRAMDHRGGDSARYVPATLRSYAGVLDTYGSWDYEPTYGNVWYPRVEVGWRPYYAGRWRHYGRFGWTWVGGGAWGWPTHHYGRWGLSNAGAWFWIPGAQWGPAWVSWAIANDYVTWCPIGFDNRPVIGWGGGNRPRGSHGRDRWHAWTVVPRQHFGGYRVVSGVAVDGRRLAGAAGRGPSFVVQERAPRPPRGGTLAEGGAPVPGVAVPRGNAGGITSGERDGRTPLDPTRGDRRYTAGGIATGASPRRGGDVAGSHRGQPPGTTSPYGSLGSRVDPRRDPTVERTPEDVARGSRVAIPRGSRPPDRLPGDVGTRPTPAQSGGAAASSPSVARTRPGSGWRADQVPVHRGGRVVGGDAPVSPVVGRDRPAPGTRTADGTSPRLREAAGDGAGGRAPREANRGVTPRGDSPGPAAPGTRTERSPRSAPPSSMPTSRQPMPPPQRMAPPSPPPSSPRQAPSGDRGSAVPRGGPPPHHR